MVNASSTAESNRRCSSRYGHNASLEETTDETTWGAILETRREAVADPLPG